MNQSMKSVICISVILSVLLIFSSTALAMTEERAVERVKEVDPDAAKAIKFWVFPDRDADGWMYPTGMDGAWVFYADGRNGALFKGRAWFVSEDRAWDLGSSDSVFSWNFYKYRNSVNDEGHTIDDLGDIFTSVTLHHGEPHVHGWTLSEEVVLEIDFEDRIMSLEVNGNCLYAMAAPYDYDYVFLCMNMGEIDEVAAVTMTQAQFEAFDGGADILRLIEDSGYGIGEVLYRNACPGADRHLKSYLDDGGVVTLNLTRDGVPAGHCYAFIERYSHEAVLQSGWFGDDLGLLEGWGTAKRDLGYDVVKSRIKE